MLLICLFRIKEIKHDKHLATFATLELAIVKHAQEHFGEARHWLNRSRNDFPSHALELMIQLRGYSLTKMINLI